MTIIESARIDAYITAVDKLEPALQARWINMQDSLAQVIEDANEEHIHRVLEALQCVLELSQI